MNKSMEIIESNYFPFDYYVAIVEKYYHKDNRELNYQNRVIIPLLEKLFINDQSIDIVDVSTQYKNWNYRKFHDRSKYAGEHTPDVLIARNWDINNKDRTDIKYLSVIEVKKPNASVNDYEHAMNEVNDYSQHVEKCILTDCVCWMFYKNGKMVRDFYLDKPCIPVCSHSNRGKEEINWKDDGATFQDLCRYLIEFF